MDETEVEDDDESFYVKGWETFQKGNCRVEARGSGGRRRHTSGYGLGKFQNLLHMNTLEER